MKSIYNSSENVKVRLSDQNESDQFLLSAYKAKKVHGFANEWNFKKTL